MPLRHHVSPCYDFPQRKSASNQSMKAIVIEPTNQPEPWCSTSAASTHLGISIPTIRRWIKSGRLRPKRTPTGAYRFRRSELDSLLE